MEGSLAVGPESKEAVAYRLLRDVAFIEGIQLSGEITGAKQIGDKGAADRKWILDTYAECLKTVWAPDARFEKTTLNERVL